LIISQRINGLARSALITVNHLRGACFILTATCRLSSLSQCRLIQVWFRFLTWHSTYFTWVHYKVYGKIRVCINLNQLT